MKHRTFDLNDADDARDYLTTMEADGKLVIDESATAQELSDDEAIALAGAVFIQVNGRPLGTKH